MHKKLNKAMINQNQLVVENDLTNHSLEIYMWGKSQHKNILIKSIKEAEILIAIIKDQIQLWK